MGAIIITINRSLAIQCVVVASCLPKNHVFCCAEWLWGGGSYLGFTFPASLVSGWDVRELICITSLSRCSRGKCVSAIPLISLLMAGFQCPVWLWKSHVMALVSVGLRRVLSRDPSSTRLLHEKERNSNSVKLLQFGGSLHQLALFYLIDLACHKPFSVSIRGTDLILKYECIQSSRAKVIKGY